jgi:hypothetical protein
MIAARINQEHEKENLAAFALHPGVVETDMVSSHSVSSLFISLPCVLLIMTPHCTISTLFPRDAINLISLPVTNSHRISRSSLLKSPHRVF